MEKRSQSGKPSSGRLGTNDTAPGKEVQQCRLGVRTQGDFMRADKLFGKIGIESNVIDHEFLLPKKTRIQW